MTSVSGFGFFSLVHSIFLSFTSSLSCSPVLRLVISLISLKLFLLLCVTLSVFFSCVPVQSCVTLCFPDRSLVCTFCKLFKIKQEKTKPEKHKSRHQRSSKKALTLIDG